MFIGTNAAKGNRHGVARSSAKISNSEILNLKAPVRVDKV